MDPPLNMEVRAKFWVISLGKQKSTARTIVEDS